MNHFGDPPFPSFPPVPCILVFYGSIAPKSCPVHPPLSEKVLMRRAFKRVCTVAVVASVVFLARSSSAQLPTKPSSKATVDTTSAQYRQFDRFLSLSVATRKPHVGMVDSVYTPGTQLGVDEQYKDMRWLAAHRILSVVTAGDTARAAAILTTTARQIDMGDYYCARYGIRDDTAHWVLVRSRDTRGRWMVNGDAAEGFSVLPLGRDIRWGMGSRRKALAAVDSIRRARGLPLIR